MLERVLPWLGPMRNQVVLVTGASSGIGRETALAFARCGASVALAARRRNLLQELASEVRKAGGKAMAVTTDVVQPRAARAAVARVQRNWGRVDVLVNNAGILIPAPLEKARPADLHAMMQVNYFGAVNMVQAVLPGMLRRKKGVIVNVASLAGRRGVAPLGGYCATKFALVGLSEALRTEVENRGVHVGLVLPGVVDTPMVHNVKQDDVLPEWPELFNMPTEWVAAAVVLATRFRLHEISVPPGAATLEVLGALAPGAADSLIQFLSATGRLVGRVSRPTRRGAVKR